MGERDEVYVERGGRKAEEFRKKREARQNNFLDYYNLFLSYSTRLLVMKLHTSELVVKIIYPWS
jgi:hypothetical protein